MSYETKRKASKIAGWILLRAAPLVVAAWGFQRCAALRFERSHPGFVEQKLALRRALISRPPSLARDEALDAVAGDLRWAALYRRLGFNPDALDQRPEDR